MLWKAGITRHLIKSQSFFIKKNIGKFVRPAILFSVDLLQDLEDLDEEVDDVQIELDGGHDVLLGTQTGHDHLKTKSCIRGCIIAQTVNN